MNDIKYDGIKLKKSLAYFACIERGFKFVTKIMEKLPEFKLYTNTYSDEYRNSLKMNTNIILSENTSTYEIFRTLNKCKYFIYPLINLDDNYIHYDTFGYVVLEALLHGVIVIAPKIKVYEELYGDAICYINTDGIIPQDDLCFWKKHNSNFGYPLLQKYVDKINELENDRSLRKSYINKGLLLSNKFNNITIKNKFLKDLNL
jgi:glycosyltransferase involved in cell wall biosynthesis